MKIRYSIIAGIPRRGSEQKDISNFEHEVEAALKEGWECQGGVAIGRGINDLHARICTCA